LSADADSHRCCEHGAEQELTLHRFASWVDAVDRFCAKRSPTTRPEYQRGSRRFLEVSRRGP
ncbi:MAG TPA: hypothetical protein VH458_00470, partial [Vicinamibacterales bacterium]